MPPKKGGSQTHHRFVASSGHNITLLPRGSTWRARVSDERHAGFSCSFTTDVIIEPAYSVKQLANECSMLQSHRIHLLPNSGGKTIVYVGSVGLKGGGCCGSPTWSCVTCGIECPGNNCELCCGHRFDHVKCRERCEEEMCETEKELRETRQKLQSSTENQDLLQQRQESHAKWKENRAKEQQRSAQQAQKVHENEEKIKRQQEEQKALAAQRGTQKAALAAQRAQYQEATREIRTRKADADELNRVSNHILAEDEEEVRYNTEEETVTTTEYQNEETDNYLEEDPAHLDSTSPGLPYPPTMNEACVVPRIPPPPFAQKFMKFLLSYLNDQNEVSCDSHSNSREGLSPKSDSSQGTISEGSTTGCASSLPNMLAASHRAVPSDSSLDTTADTRPTGSLGKARAVGLNKLLCFTAYFLGALGISYIYHSLKKYAPSFSPGQIIHFYGQARKYIQIKLSSASQEIQQSVQMDLESNSSKFFRILEQYPTSVSPLRNRWPKIFEDPIFQERWVKITEKYDTDHQVQLLQSIFEAKKTVNISLGKVNHILEVILITNITDGNFAPNEPLLNRLVTWKKGWLMVESSNLLPQSLSVLEADQLADALANTHLSMHFIQDFLNLLKEADEAIDFAELLEFLDLVKEKAVPEAILRTTFKETETLTGQISKPLQWIHSLISQLLSMRIARVNPSVADGIAAALYRTIQQNRSVAVPIEAFVTNHLKQIVNNSSEFEKVLQSLIRYNVGKTICTAVLERLSYEPPENWVDATEQVIISKIFEADSREYTVEELIRLIARGTSASINDPLAATATNYNLADNTLESTYKKQVAEILKPCFKSALDKLKLFYKKALNAIEEKIKKLKEKKLENQKKIKRLEEDFEKRKVSHKREVNRIQTEVEQIETKLNETAEERAKKLEEEKLNEAELKKKEAKLIKREGELKQKLGNNEPNDAEPAATPADAADTKLESKETRPKQLLQDLINEENNINETFLALQSTFLDETRRLDEEEKALDVDIDESEETRNVYLEKLEKLDQEDATYFSDYSCYEEVLRSFIEGISELEMIPSSLLKESSLPFKNKAMKRWNKDEVTNWSAFVRKQMQSDDYFSCGFVELLAGIKHAGYLTGTSSPSSLQLFELLKLVFPFHRDSQLSTNDPLVVAMLAIITVLHLEQVSLITDSKYLPMSEAQIRQHIPLFEFLNVMATERKSWSGNRAPVDKSHIVYGTFADFKNQESNLLAGFEELTKRKKVVNNCYNSPSAIVQTAELIHILPRNEAISAWGKEAITQWAVYVQNYMPSNNAISPSVVTLEYVAVAMQAVNQAYGEPPTSNQLWALLTCLAKHPDKKQLTVEDQKETPVVAMLAAVNALQRKQSDVTTMCIKLPAESSNQHTSFFNMLNLHLDASQLVRTSTVESSNTRSNSHLYPRLTFKNSVHLNPFFPIEKIMPFSWWDIVAGFLKAFLPLLVIALLALGLILFLEVADPLVAVAAVGFVLFLAVPLLLFSTRAWSALTAVVDTFEKYRKKWGSKVDEEWLPQVVELSSNYFTEIVRKTEEEWIPQMKAWYSNDFTDIVKKMEGEWIPVAVQWLYNLYTEQGSEITEDETSQTNCSAISELF